MASPGLEDQSPGGERARAKCQQPGPARGVPCRLEQQSLAEPTSWREPVRPPARTAPTRLPAPPDGLRGDRADHLGERRTGAGRGRHDRDLQHPLELGVSAGAYLADLARGVLGDPGGLGARAPSARASAVAARCSAACASSRLCSASATGPVARVLRRLDEAPGLGVRLLDLLACACFGPFGAHVSGADRGVLLVLHLLSCTSWIALRPGRPSRSSGRRAGATAWSSSGAGSAAAASVARFTVPTGTGTAALTADPSAATSAKSARCWPTRLTPSLTSSTLLADCCYC